MLSLYRAISWVSIFYLLPKMLLQQQHLILRVTMVVDHPIIRIFVVMLFGYKDLVICKIKWKDQGRNRARSGDGEVLQAEPVLNDQLGEYRYLNSKQIMQQATTSTIAVEPEVQSDELDKLNKDTGFLLAEQEQSIRPLERSTLMTSGFEVESLLPTVRYDDDIQSAETNLSIDMNELLNFLDLPSTSNVQDPVIECTDLSKKMEKNSAEENGGWELGRKSLWNSLTLAG